MDNDIYVFIFSHGRADTVKTYKSLVDAGCTKPIRIIVDNLDKDKDRYIAKFGADKVIIFDKNEWEKRTDTITNDGDLRSVVFARNASFEIAKGLGAKFVLMCDDDLTDFTYRFVKNGKLKSKHCKRFSEILDAMRDFCDGANLASLNIASSGSMFGGAKGSFKKGLAWNITACYMVNIGSPIDFKGICNEDLNATLLSAKAGRLCLETFYLCKNTPVRSTNVGGLHDLYKKYDDYQRAMYSVVVSPSCVKVRADNGVASVIRKFAYPKILRESIKQ